MIRVGAMGWNDAVAADAAPAGTTTTAATGTSNAAASTPTRAIVRQLAIETSCRRPTGRG
jgi:hypothetical protein